MKLFGGESYPVAENLSKMGLYLPSSSGLKSDEIDFIIESILSIKNSL